MIDELVNDLKSDEGWRPSVYQDHLGFWTIGWGFLIDERKGGEIPVHIAEEWLTYMVTQKWNALVLKHEWVNDLPDNVQKALGNMVYQMGVSGVSNFKRMMAALKAGDWLLAALEANDSKWAKQTPNRAKRVTDLMRGET